MKWLESSQDDVPSCPMCRQPWEFAADEARDAGSPQSDQSWSRSTASLTSVADTAPEGDLDRMQGSVRAMQLVFDSDEEDAGAAVPTLDLTAGDAGGEMGHGQADTEAVSVASMSSSSIDLDLDQL